MDKFNILLETARYAIEQKYKAIVMYDQPHKMTNSPIQMTTKELKAVLLKHGEYVKVMASATMWTCGIHKKNLGAGVYSVWLSFVVVKKSYREPMPEPNHN